MGGSNLYIEGDSTLGQRELEWRMNREVSERVIHEVNEGTGRDGLDEECVTETSTRGRERECVWQGAMGEKRKEQVDERMSVWRRSGGKDWGDQMRAWVAGTINECQMKGRGYCEQVKAWANEQIAKQTSGWRLCVSVCSCKLWGRCCTCALAGKWMSEAWWKRLSEWVMGVSDGCVDRKCQL